MDQETEQARNALNSSLFFIVVVIASVLLSFFALLKQRNSLPEGAPGPVLRLRLGSSALIIGALGFFFCQALSRQEQADRGTDPTERQSAGLNALAATLVLAAALVRLEDLLLTADSGELSLLSGDDPLPA